MDHFIEKFFYDLEEYRNFIDNRSTKLLKTDEHDSCFAELLHEGKYLKYNLFSIETNFYAGDYVKVFEPTEENVALFNQGSKRVAEMLRQMDAAKSVEACNPNEQPFGSLTYTPSNQNHPESYIKKLISKYFNINLPIAGGVGITKDNAIIILEEAGSSYVAVAYQYIKYFTALLNREYRVKNQRLILENGRAMDEITLEMRDVDAPETGTILHTLYFDITDCWHGGGLS